MARINELVDNLRAIGESTTHPRRVGRPYTKDCVDSLKGSLRVLANQMERSVAEQVIVQGAYDLAIENLRLVREEFLKEGKTDLVRVEELLFVDAWRQHRSQSESEVS